MTLPTINMLWIGDSLSLRERLAITSFLQNGHAVRLFTYGKVRNVPAGAEVVRGDEILPKSKIFKVKGSYAAFADYFRWELMAKHGGFYCDTDVICLKPFVFFQDIIIGAQDKYGYSEYLTPTVLKLPKGHMIARHMASCSAHPLWPRMYDSKEKLKQKFKYIRNFEFPKAIGWGETAGPWGLTRAFYHYKWENLFKVQPTNVFYPVHYTEVKKIVEPGALSLDDLPEESKAIHLWNEMWNCEGINKNEVPPENSLYWQLLKKYDVI